MDSTAVRLLRELLAGDPLMGQTQDFARVLNRSATTPGGLLLVGTPTQEPWHMAAHLDDESRLAAMPELKPTLVRWQPPTDAPPHLSIGLERIERTTRKETVFVVAGDQAPDELLERVFDAKKIGARILTMVTAEAEITEMAHEVLIIPDEDAAAGVRENPLPDLAATADAHEKSLGISFDAAQHVVSMAAGEFSRGSEKSGLKSRLARMIDGITGPGDAWS